MPTIEHEVEVITNETVSVDFEVTCSCGYGLCNDTAVKYLPRGIRLVVEPCQHCIDRAIDKAIDKYIKEQQ